MRNHFFCFLILICALLFPVTSWAQTSPKIFFDSAKLEKKDGAYILSGSIQKDKHKETDPVPLSTISITASFYTYPKGEGDTAVLVLPAIGYRPNSSLTEQEKILFLNNNFPFKGLAEDGTYHFLMTNPPLNDNTLYTIVVSFKSTTGAVGEGVFRGTTDKGIIPGTEEAFINERSYRLLAPIPGMTLLLDPELCQAEQQAGKAGQICDINAFINFLLSLAIGAAAVVLVVRIIISGYSYMTTDIPFLKAKTKGQFVEALIGLLVALSSYLILNTISPRLVSNDLKIGAVSFDVEEITILKSLGINPGSPEAKLLSAEDIKKYKISYAGTKKYIKDVYIPARDAALPNASKNIKALMTSHMYVEGFFPGSMAERTNNPGNIGNQSGQQGEGGKRTCYATLEDGIKRQYQHFLKVANNNNPNYKLGARRDGPRTPRGDTLAIAPQQRLFETLPSKHLSGYFAFIYDSSIWQYLYIYSPETTEKRKTYLSGVLSYLASEGIAATADTKISTFVSPNEPQISEPNPTTCSTYAWTGRR